MVKGGFRAGLLALAALGACAPAASAIGANSNIVVAVEGLTPAGSPAAVDDTFNATDAGFKMGTSVRPSGLSFGALKLTKVVDASSPPLVTAFAHNHHFPSLAVLIKDPLSGQSISYLERYCFEDVSIASMATTVTSTNPIETLVLTYRSVAFELTSIDVFGWDTSTSADTTFRAHCGSSS